MPVRLRPRARLACFQIFRAPPASDRTASTNVECVTHSKGTRLKSRRTSLFADFTAYLRVYN